MKRTRVRAAALGAIASLSLLAGCGTAQEAQQQPASTQAPAKHHDEADVSFARGMVVHHQQAVEMSRLAADRAGSPQVRELAEQIEAAQGPEIERLEGWLRDWGAAPAQHGGHGEDGQMHGMMSAEQLHGLSRASGADFDRRFLSMMIEHHEGAVRMARTELDSGASPEAKRLAQGIIDTQQAEIDTMRGLLAR
ncbi:DUF305 domain-containing protein [Saccharopolyspora griseoalba]|uniref:DUF305 domain-containing protein n=1 Tax=Saccharopolyspora griseoalba TaxID=1431848 RepID=A0ABW2LBV9_9PSEU